MPPKDKTQVLPPKEAALFKQVVQFYEKKQYKKGIKAADQILKKNPEHGETLAMKGLTINCMGDDKKEEAYDLVKKGIKYNMMSHVCWHVYGLLYRSDRNYNAAIKSYNQALKMEKDNLQILRDLALLQIHMRDLHGGLKTRHTLLTLKPTQRANWMGFAMANHMLDRHKTAIKIIEAYENIGDDNDSAYELSELVLYKNAILVEAGELSTAYDHLQENKDRVCDKLAMHEASAQLLLSLERNEEAAKAYRFLIDLNVDNLKYHEGLQKALKLDEALLTAEYVGIREKYPKSNAPLRISLDITSGAVFKTCADIYIRKFLRRGIQSLFSDLKPLYADSAKVALLSALYQELATSLEASGKFPATESEPEPPVEGPMVQMWLMLLLANHYDRANQPLLALECISKGVEHTPTCIELQLCKARVLKHHGDAQQAAEVIDQARCMDLADRYLNTRCTVYMLRADQSERAEKVVVLFTKEELTGGTNLFDMQCMWWEIESGNSFIRQGRYGEALKKLTAVEKHFEDIHEDQFDFHSYCLRKMTLRSYMAMLRNEDKVRTNKFFIKAAKAIIETCLHLHDCPPAFADPEAAFAGMTEGEKKKALKKAAREEKKKTEALEKAREEHARNKKKGPLDEDPLGETLLKKIVTDGALSTGAKYVKLLQQAWAGEVLTHTLAYQVYSRLGKPVLCAQALLRASKIDPSHPEVHLCVRDFCSKASADSHPTVAAVVDEIRAELRASNTPEQFKEQHGSKSADHVIAAAESMMLHDPQSMNAVCVFVTDLTAPGMKWEHAVKVHQMLQSWKADEACVKQYYDACAEKFPCAVYFHPVAAQ